MELKIARTDVKSKAEKIDVKKIEEMVKKEGTVILYFDRDNSHKDFWHYRTISRTMARASTCAKCVTAWLKMSICTKYTSYRSQ